MSKNFLTGSIIGFGMNKTLKLDNKISDKAVDVAKKYVEKKNISPSIFFDRFNSVKFVALARVSCVE